MLLADRGLLPSRKADGRVVQVDTRLTSDELLVDRTRFQRSRLKHNEVLSNFAFNFNLRHHIVCGDVDVFITPPTGAVHHTMQAVLLAVLTALRANGLLTDDLSVSNEMYMGVARLPPGYRLPSEIVAAEAGPGPGVGAGAATAAEQASAAAAAAAAGVGAGGAVTAGLEGGEGAGEDSAASAGAGAGVGAGAGTRAAAAAGAGAGTAAAAAGPGGEPKAKRQNTSSTTATPPPPPAPQRLHWRIDIKVFLPEHFPFALLFFGSSELFSRSIRRIAMRYGWSLNQVGCYRLPKTAASRIGGYAAGPYNCALHLFQLNFSTFEKRIK